MNVYTTASQSAAQGELGKNPPASSIPEKTEKTTPDSSTEGEE